MTAMLNTIVAETLNIAYSDEEIASLIKSHQAHTHFSHVVQSMLVMQDVQRTLQYAPLNLRQDVSTALNQLERLYTNFIQAFIERFKNIEYVGDESAFLAPKLIIVLGCDAPVIDYRVKKAYQLAQKHPHVPIVLSGGGFSGFWSEARYMANFLEDKAVNNPLVIEEESLDTLGNALFSRLELHKKGLHDIDHVLIVTSRFHAFRSHYYFSKFFQEPLAVTGVTSISAEEELSRAKHELSISKNRKKNIFTFEYLDKTYDIATNDYLALLYQMINKHDYYRGRYDLLRKYRRVIFS